jgi:hypothetical protein
MIAGILGGMGLKVAILAVLVTAGGLFYWHYTTVKSERDEALMRVGALETAKAVQDSTIAAQSTRLAEFAQAQEALQATLEELQVQQAEANKEARILNDVLSKHDLHRLSQLKPGLIENRINRGSASVLGMFESATSGDQDDRDRPASAGE